MLNACSNFVGGFAKVVETFGRPERSIEGVLHAAEVQGSADIWRRFGGGSDRNRALLGNSCNSGHFMHIAQSRINTGNCAAC